MTTFLTYPGNMNIENRMNFKKNKNRTPIRRVTLKPNILVPVIFIIEILTENVKVVK